MPLALRSERTTGSKGETMTRSAWLCVFLIGMTGQACGHWSDDDDDYRAARGGGQVHVAPNGALRVSFGNDCVVRYDYTGRRRSSSDACSDRQVRSADDVAQSHFARRGDGFGVGRASNAPEISQAANGAIRVTFGDDCIVRYDQTGRRRSASQECSQRQVQRADAAAASYRRQRL
jgi:hypothetical protein